MTPPSRTHPRLRDDVQRALYEAERAGQAPLLPPWSYNVRGVREDYSLRVQDAEDFADVGRKVS